MQTRRSRFFTAYMAKAKTTLDTETTRDVWPSLASSVLRGAGSGPYAAALSGARLLFAALGAPRRLARGSAGPDTSSGVLRRPARNERSAGRLAGEDERHQRQGLAALQQAHRREHLAEHLALGRAEQRRAALRASVSSDGPSGRLNASKIDGVGG